MIIKLCESQGLGMCKFLFLSHIAKIHIILIKQTIFSKKLKKKREDRSSLSYRNFPSYFTDIVTSSLGIVNTHLPSATDIADIPTPDIVLMVGVRLVDIVTIPPATPFV